MTLQVLRGRSCQLTSEVAKDGWENVAAKIIFAATNDAGTSADPSTDEPTYTYQPTHSTPCFLYHALSVTQSAKAMWQKKRWSKWRCRCLLDSQEGLRVNEGREIANIRSKAVAVALKIELFLGYD